MRELFGQLRPLLVAALGMVAAVAASAFVGYMVAFFLVLWMVEGGYRLVPQGMETAVRVVIVLAFITPVAFAVWAVVQLTDPSVRKVVAWIGVALGLLALGPMLLRIVQEGIQRL